MQHQKTAEEDAQLSFQKYYKLNIFFKKDSSFIMESQTPLDIQCFTLNSEKHRQNGRIYFSNNLIILSVATGKSVQEN